MPVPVLAVLEVSRPPCGHHAAGDLIQRRRCRIAKVQIPPPSEHTPGASVAVDMIVLHLHTAT